MGPGEIHTLGTHLTSVTAAIANRSGLGARGKGVAPSYSFHPSSFQKWFYLGVIQYIKAFLFQGYFIESPDGKQIHATGEIMCTIQEQEGSCTRHWVLNDERPQDWQKAVGFYTSIEIPRADIGCQPVGGSGWPHLPLVWSGNWFCSMTRETRPRRCLPQILPSCEMALNRHFHPCFPQKDWCATYTSVPHRWCFQEIPANYQHKQNLHWDLHKVR